MLNETPYQKMIELLQTRWGGETFKKMEMDATSFAELFFQNVSKNVADYRHVKNHMVAKQVLFLNSKTTYTLDMNNLREQSMVSQSVLDPKDQ